MMRIRFPEAMLTKNDTPPPRAAAEVTVTSVTVNTDPGPLETARQESKGRSKEKKTASSRVKVIISKKDREGEPIESEGELPVTKEQDDSAHAFVLKRIIFDSTSLRPDSSEINITSPDLWDLLKKNLRWYPYHIFSDSPVTLNSPYQPIVFSWDQLHEAAFRDGAESEKQAKDDLKLLLDTISGGASGDGRLDRFFKMRGNYKNQQQHETVQFDDLWTIFAPGTLIYGKSFQNEEQVFVVKDNRMIWPRWNDRAGEYVPWSLEGWSYDWNDGSFRRTNYILTFERFDGSRPVTTLPYYPLEVHEDYESVQSRLIERGKLFQQYCNAKKESRMFDYKGEAILEKKGFSGMQNEDTDNQHDSRSSSDYEFGLFHRLLSRGSHRVALSSVTSSPVDGRVMMDYASFYQYGSANGRNGPLSRGESGWAQLQVTNLKVIAHVNDQDAWNSRLKLADNDTKNLLFDLVRCHVSSETQDNDDEKPLSVDDIVPGKGKGLVILLYGPPGVGKSSTAETIAVAARKPLFSISVADVVFLRVLEYYRGIMFLTTNQIAEFDIAIPSRIHIAIKYENLRTDQMEAIFRGFLDNLNKRNLVENYNEIMNWLKEDVYSEGLDGRQIRNTITTALDLANADTKYNNGNNKLGKSHIKRAFNNAKKFKRDFDTQMQRYKDSQNKMIQ
ncbi:hypothetical protein E0Z10_g9747 [Xylaria hypoxylon]|uniref:Uncharacterized protein n=1 Tax=Xylaria hypoxylon TaxID=37992 RepID=A0A4Z0YIB6_9PEZI|nr:hypothetical protein E0Z10_g9747 [Xylaria hypoxylon]